MNRYFKLITQKINIIFVIITFIIFILGMIIMRQSSQKVSAYAHMQEKTILDLRMGYTQEDIENYLTNLGEHGRLYYYKNFYVIDLFYPLTYTIFYFSFLLFLIKKYIFEKKIIKFLLLLPLLGLLCDWGENICIRFFIKNFTQVSKNLSMISSCFTILKFIFVYCSLISIVVLLILKLLGKIYTKDKR